MPANLDLFNFLHSFAGLYWPLDWLIIFLGTYLAPVLIVLSLVFVFRHRAFKVRFSILSFLAMSLIIAAIFVVVGRFSINNPRPFIVLNFTPLIDASETHSFPSMHMTLFTSLAFALWFINRKTGYWFLFGAILIGIGRIIAGVHWPIDILGGLLCGALSAYIAYKLFPHKEYLKSNYEL
ncbi:MAG: phosphatase PAP2 family protein [bacterium]|nr:phosphatase PAP2 family protein [bacterium]